MICLLSVTRTRRFHDSLSSHPFRKMRANDFRFIHLEYSTRSKYSDLSKYSTHSEYSYLSKYSTHSEYSDYSNILHNPKICTIFQVLWDHTKRIKKVKKKTNAKSSPLYWGLLDERVKLKNIQNPWMGFESREFIRLLRFFLCRNILQNKFRYRSRNSKSFWKYKNKFIHIHLSYGMYYFECA